MKTNCFYKAYVVAYKLDDGKKVTLAKSANVFFLNADKSSKLANPSFIKATTDKVTLKKGKTQKLQVNVTLPTGKKQGTGYAEEVRYISSDKSVATVTATGTVKGVKKGSCSVYVYTINGLYHKISVTVA